MDTRSSLSIFFVGSPDTRFFFPFFSLPPCPLRPPICSVIGSCIALVLSFPSFRVCCSENSSPLFASALFSCLRRLQFLNSISYSVSLRVFYQAQCPISTLPSHLFCFLSRYPSSYSCLLDLLPRRMLSLQLVQYHFFFSGYVSSIHPNILFLHSPSYFSLFLIIPAPLSSKCLDPYQLPSLPLFQFPLPNISLPHHNHHHDPTTSHQHHHHHTVPSPTVRHQENLGHGVSVVFICLILLCSALTINRLPPNCQPHAHHRKLPITLP